MVAYESARLDIVCGESRGVAVGIAEDGRVTVARGDLAGMSTHERGLVAHALADLLAGILGRGGVRVH